MHYENLVFGATLDSLFFAMKKGYPVVYAEPKKPTFLKPEELSAWKKSYFYLSLSGLLPFSDKVRNATLGDKSLSLLTSQKRFEVTYGHLHIFDEEGLRNLPDPVKRDNEKVRVLDWVHITKGGARITIEELTFEPGFIERVEFYSTLRYSNPLIKDLVAYSTIPKSEVNEEQYSELYSRFKIEDLLTSNGISPDTIYESHKREVFDIDRPLRHNTESISFIYEKQEVCYNSDFAYLNFIMETLNENSE